MGIENCVKCGEELSHSSSSCVVCGYPADPPNVRAARASSELDALNSRLQEADQSGLAGNYTKNIELFRDSASRSEAVVARSVAILHNLVDSDNMLLATFHNGVRAGFRIPEDNEWDKGRTAAESTISPGYYENIHYACLTLDGFGAKSFGDYSITFIEEMIAERSTVFEENVFVFCDRHSVVAGKSPPPGYRAVWAERQNLAVAKLHSKLNGVGESQFAGILLDQGTKPEDADFIEVHIYGPLHRKAIASVSGPKPKRGTSKALWKFVKEELSTLNIKVIET